MRYPGSLFLLGSGLCLGLVGTALLMVKFLGIAACPLCIWQRIFYLAYAALGLVGFVLARHGARRLPAVGMAVMSLAGAGVASYQVWIQRFAPTITCGGRERWWEAAVGWLGQRMPLLFQADGQCSDPAWEFLGLYLAEWSLLMFAVLFVLAAVIFLRHPRTVI